MARERLLVVGAGIVGATVALQASMAGLDVTMVERRALLSGTASTSSLGAVRVSGRMPGAEFDDVLRSRQRWEAIASRVPGVGFTATGSLMLLADETELAAAESYAVAMGGALHLSVLHGSSAVSAMEPAVAGVFAGALICADDAWIRPYQAVPAIVDYLTRREAIRVRMSTELLDIDTKGDHVIAVTTAGRIATDHIVLTVGEVWLPHAMGSDLESQGLARVHYHAIDIGRSERPIPRMLLTDASALDYYPGYAVFTSAVAGAGTFGIESADWVASSTSDSRVLVGIARTTDPVLPAGTRAWLSERTNRALGFDDPKAQAWSVPLIDFDRSTARHSYVSFSPMPGVSVITGLGQFGNTLAPLVAWQFVDDLQRNGQVAERLGVRPPISSPSGRPVDAITVQPTGVPRIAGQGPRSLEMWSHAIRTPLTVVRAAIHELATPTSELTTDAAAELLTLAYDAVERLTTIVDDLFFVTEALTPSTPLGTTTIDLTEQTISVLREGVHLVKHGELAPAWALGEAHLIRQMIRSLVAVATAGNVIVALSTGTSGGWAWVEAVTMSDSATPTPGVAASTTSEAEVRALTREMGVLGGVLGFGRAPGDNAAPGRLAFRANLRPAAEPA